MVELAIIVVALFALFISIIAITLTAILWQRVGDLRYSVKQLNKSWRSILSMAKPDDKLATVNETPITRIPFPPEDPNKLLAAPLSIPTRYGQTIAKDWLTHYAPGTTWAEVVSKFYDRAAADPAVFSYFSRTDMTALKKHFTQVMIAITHKGITVGDRNMLIRVHSKVRSQEGLPITAQIYDAVIDTLISVLVECKIPATAIYELDKMLMKADLKSALVQH